MPSSTARSWLFLSLALFAAAAACWTGCTSRPQAAKVAPAPPGAAPMNAACDAACAAPTQGDNESICYSCRCKQALGALPTPEEMKCSDGEEIEIYRDGVKVTEPVADCENPALLYTVPYAAACLPGSRMKQFEKGDAVFKLLCRRKEWHPDWMRPTEDSIYEDLGLIGYNPKTGATCFWDDLVGTPHDGDAIADVDLTVDSAARARAFAATWITENGDGTTCLQCHDSDPFIQTSYLKSLKTFPNPGRSPRAPYALVSPTAPTVLVSTGLSHLSSDGASECTGCHRIGLNETCRRFAADAMGFKSTIGEHARPYQDHARDNDGTNARGYDLAYWMPVDSPATHGEWQADFLATKNHLMRCCGPPDYDAGATDDAGCAVEPIPGPSDGGGGDR